MHLLFLNSTAQLGGAERVLFDLVAGLRVNRPHWTLTLCVPGVGVLVERARALGIRVVVLPFPASLAMAGDYGFRMSVAAKAAPSAVVYALKLRHTLARLAPDVIHSNGLKMHLAAAWTKPRSARLVWHLHDYVSRRDRSARLLKRSAGACAAIVANSQSVADDAVRVFGSSGRSHAIRNGVNVAAFHPDGPRVDLDALAGLAPAPPDTVRVGLVATYARWKGQPAFLEAIARIPRNVPLRAYVVGGPIYQTAGSQFTRAELETIAERAGVRDRVGFISFADDAAAVYRALDVVVHASVEPEPFGLIIAEAMACGRAVIAAAGGGAMEIVTPGLDSLVHRPGDVVELADRITTLATDVRLRARLGRVARQSAEARLDQSAVTGQFCHLYEQVLGRKVPTAAEPFDGVHSAAHG